MAVLLTGCSFAFVRGPGSVGPAQCNRSYVLPAGDFLVLLPAMWAVTFVGAYACHEGNDGVGCTVGMPTLFIADLATIVSGIYGIATVHSCRSEPEPEPEPEPTPPPKQRDLGCEQRRAELQRAALAEPDLEKRTRMLQALPSC